MLEAQARRADAARPRLWELSFGSGLYLVAQVAIIGFVVLFLHDERGVSDGAAAGRARGDRSLGGRAADRRGPLVGRPRLSDRPAAARRRSPPRWPPGSWPLLTGASLWILVPRFVVAGGLAMAWNGLSFTAAAELAGMRRSGAAIGFQQSVLSAAGAIVPPAFAAVVAVSSWRLGFGLAALFPLLGVQLLRPLRS